jgi:hypothetical protein
MTPPDSALTRFTAILASLSALPSLRQRLCEASRIMLEAEGVVVTSDTVGGEATTVCWTHPLSKRLESVQNSSGEGPLIDSLASGTVVLGDFAASDDARWPRLRRRIAGLDFAGTLIAIPLRSDLPLRGALLVHRDAGSRETDAGDARFLGAAIGTAVLQDPSLGAQGHVFAEILTDRDLVHAATEALRAQASVRYEDALALLRSLAFTRGEDLGTIARAVVDGRTGLGQDE